MFYDENSCNLLKFNAFELKTQESAGVIKNSCREIGMRVRAEKTVPR